MERKMSISDFRALVEQRQKHPDSYLAGRPRQKDSAMRPRARLVPPLLLSTVAIGTQGKESGGDL